MKTFTKTCAILLLAGTATVVSNSARAAGTCAVTTTNPSGAIVNYDNPGCTQSQTFYIVQNGSGSNSIVSYFTLCATNSCDAAGQWTKKKITSSNFLNYVKDVSAVNTMCSNASDLYNLAKSAGMAGYTCVCELPASNNIPKNFQVHPGFPAYLYKTNTYYDRTTCTTRTEEEWGCANGYYGEAYWATGASGPSGCTRCPSYKDSDGDTWYGNTPLSNIPNTPAYTYDYYDTDGAITVISDCFIRDGTSCKDDAGVYSVSSCEVTTGTGDSCN